MAKAAPFLIEIAPDIDDATEYGSTIANTLREEHGVHGARLAGSVALAGADVQYAPALTVAVGSGDERVLGYSLPDGTVRQLPVEQDGLSSALSTLVVEKLRISPPTQSSRSDKELLADYAGPRPQLDKDPSIWIARNPFVAELSRISPNYGNLVRYLCNERGLFLKVGNYPSERAYWNSTTNAGLPVVKKADPVHEGTFMLHDLFHFVPIDPMLGEGQIDEAKQATYMAHRMMSEASTLVLADMIAVADADLVSQGYDTTRRQIFPVYQSIVEAQGAAPDIDKLLAANVYFCFTGDTKGFELLGASPDALNAYRAKYDAIFRDDFMWNMQNLDHMRQERAASPAMAEYQSWLQHEGGFPTLTTYDSRVVSREGVNIAEMLSNFRGAFYSALTYQKPLDNMERQRLATQKYLAGQRIVFARYANYLSPDGYLTDFDDAYGSLGAATNASEISSTADYAAQVTDEYLAKLNDRGLFLPHEYEANKFAAPLYPVRFVNYERKVAGGESLSERIATFTHANSGQLGRLLEIVTA